MSEWDDIISGAVKAVTGERPEPGDCESLSMASGKRYHNYSKRPTFIVDAFRLNEKMQTNLWIANYRRGEPTEEIQATLPVGREVEAAKSLGEQFLFLYGKP